MENEKVFILDVDQLHNIIDLIKEFKLKSEEFLESLNEETEELTELMTSLFSNKFEEDEENYPLLLKNFNAINNIRNTLFLRIFQYQLILNYKIDNNITDLSKDNDNTLVNILNNYVNLEFWKQIQKALENEEISSEDINIKNITFSYKFDNLGNLYLSIREDKEETEEDMSFNEENNSEDKGFLTIDELNDIGKDNFLICSIDPIEDENFIDSINETLRKNIIFSLTYSKIDIKSTVEEVFKNNEKEKCFISLLFLSKDFSHCFIEEFNKRYMEKVFNEEDELALNKTVNNFLNKQFQEYEFPMSMNKGIICDNSYITTSKNIAEINDDFNTAINNSKETISVFIQALINKYNKEDEE